MEVHSLQRIYPIPLLHKQTTVGLVVQGGHNIPEYMPIPRHMQPH